MRSKLKFGLISLIVLAFGWLFFGGQAEAVGNILPYPYSFAPYKQNKIVVSADTGGGVFHSPDSTNYLYIRRGAPVPQSVTMQNIANGRITRFEVGYVAGGGQYALASIPYAGGTASNQTIGFNHLNYGLIDTIDFQGSVYNTYYVKVSTSSTLPAGQFSNVTFQLTTPGGNFLGAYSGADGNIGTGYFRGPARWNGTKWVWDDSISFATPCSTVSSLQDILLYDLDMYLNVNEDMRVAVRAYHRNTGWPVSTGLYDPGPGKPNTVFDGRVPLEGDLEWFGGNTYKPLRLNGTNDDSGSTWNVRLAGAAAWQRKYTYQLEITGIGNLNKIRIRIPFDQINSVIDCDITEPGPMSCVISPVSSFLAPNAYTNVNVTVKNDSGADWNFTPSRNFGANNYIMGVVDRTKPYAAVNGSLTALPPTGIGPPDNTSNVFTQSSGSPTTQHYVEAGGGYAVGRYGMRQQVKDGESRTFTIRVRAPSAAGQTAFYGVRVMDRYQFAGADWNWFNWDSTCAFSVTAVSNFALTPSVSSLPPEVNPGQVLNVTYNVCTRPGDTPAPNVTVDPNGNIWNPIFPNQTIPGNGGCWSVTVPFTVPNALAGTQYCASVRAAPQSSSNGTWIDSGQTCTRIRAINNAQCWSIAYGGGVQFVGGAHYVEPGQPVTVTIQMLNTGNTIWTPGSNYRLVSIDPGWRNDTDPDDFDVPAATLPGGIATMTFTVTAPTNGPFVGPRTYLNRWQMGVNSSLASLFGNVCAAPLNVTERYDVGTPINGSGSVDVFVPGEVTTLSLSANIPNYGAGNSQDFSGGVVDTTYQTLLNGVPWPSNQLLSAATPLNPAFNQTVTGNSSLPIAFNVDVVPSIPVSLGDEICVQVRAFDIQGWEGGPLTNAGPTAWATIACLTAAERPYFVVLNNNIWAGGDFDPSLSGYGRSSCPVPGGQSNGFISARLGSTVGAYASYLAGATGRVERFSTRTASPFDPSLIMANQTSFGDFSVDGRCVTDLHKYLEKDPAQPGVDILNTGLLNAGALPSGQYVHTGDLVITSPLDLGVDRKFTILVDGNVTIQQSITSSGAYANASQIPSLIIAATGDIDIYDTVGQLYGVFFAQGEIDTCANQPGNLTVAQCFAPLTVDGLFSAFDIQLRRTRGGITGINGSTEPAEIFTNTNLVYLSQPFLISEFENDLVIDLIKDLTQVIVN